MGLFIIALASQSLSVVSELIPYVRETFRRHLNQAEAVLLVDFDKLKRVSCLASGGVLVLRFFASYCILLVINSNLGRRRVTHLTRLLVVLTANAFLCLRGASLFNTLLMNCALWIRGGARASLPYQGKSRNQW